MDLSNEVLLIPEKADKERDALALVWQQYGGKVIRIGRFWHPPKTGNGRVSIYGNDTFALVLAQVLGRTLLSPQDELVAQLPYRWVKRKLGLIVAKYFAADQLPVFIKSVKPKLLAAKVVRLENEVEAIQALDNEILICSEVVDLVAEARAFVLGKQVQDLALYEGNADLETAQQFIHHFLHAAEAAALPHSFVLDIGYNKTGGWCIIEFNSSWGAGLNHCRPEKVLASIRAATI
ncbi:ATP-grasp domain-containing protein [uncultured Microscilla sp.]|uniref:ATP-grasp domain-containing protein n=1 Tax=uncultured Microscilla sp. TaxID=432653 RepID=UPI002609281C|nr:ATP-grasp domain-containing protein [uncultured Microscilla sp.]